MCVTDTENLKRNLLLGFYFRLWSYHALSAFYNGILHGERA